MITYKVMTEQQAYKLGDIDRSEQIDLIYEHQGERLVEIPMNHECPAWDQDLLRELKERFVTELRSGGTAIGAFNGETLAGFGLLASAFRGEQQDRLQVDLMYVSRNYRRQGIGRQILSRLSEKARARGAKCLYISSTETRSAVSFYRSMGSEITDELDEELYRKEPKDIHMTIRLL